MKIANSLITREKIFCTTNRFREQIGKKFPLWEEDREFSGNPIALNFLCSRYIRQYVQSVFQKSGLNSGLWRGFFHAESFARAEIITGIRMGRRSRSVVLKPNTFLSLHHFALLERLLVRESFPQILFVPSEPEEKHHEEDSFSSALEVLKDLSEQNNPHVFLENIREDHEE